MPWPDARVTGEVAEGYLVTHYIHHALQDFDRMIVLRRGEFVADDPGPRTFGVGDAEYITTGEELRA